jgi:hypothetical protein
VEMTSSNTLARNEKSPYHSATPMRSYLAPIGTAGGWWLLAIFNKRFITASRR